MNAPAIFAFNAAAVRVFTIQDAPWFMATDVAGILGYRNAPDMTRMLDEDEKGTHIVRTLGGDQEVSTVNESGLYACILKSRRPEAKTFRKWVTSEVLPSIRQHGGYSVVGAAVSRDEPLSLNHRADVQVSADRIFRSMLRSGRSAGLGLPRALRRANEIALQKTGVNMLADLEAEDLLSEPEEGPINDNGVTAFMLAWSEGRLPVPYTICRSSDLFAAYVAWCSENDYTPTRSAQFAGRSCNAVPRLERFISAIEVEGQQASTRLVAPPGSRNFTDGLVARGMGVECARFAAALNQWRTSH